MISARAAFCSLVRVQQSKYHEADHECQKDRYETIAVS